MKLAQKIIQNGEEINLDVNAIGFEDLQGIARLLGWGVIVDSGRNQYGRFVKFGDGTMICYDMKTPELTTSNTSGNNFVSNTAPYLEFPQNFVGSPTISYSIMATNNYPFGFRYTNLSGNGMNGIVLFGIAATSAGILNFTAIGRWKD